MMKSKIKFDVNAMTLTVSKKFWNNASVPFSPEYETIKRIRQDYPSCRIEVKKTVSVRKPRTNPTYNDMMLYIEAQPNAAELMDEAINIITNVDILQDGGIILCESGKDWSISEVPAPYRVVKSYDYGSTRITTITKGE